MKTTAIAALSALLFVACGAQLVEVGAGQASVENAAAAVVVLEGDPFEADEQVKSIRIPEEEGRLFAANLRSSTVFTEGEPSGSVFVQLIFQTVATTEDRQEIADRVAALGLDEPIWLGPEDQWPFCAERPCEMVKEDGRFPN